MAYKYPSRLYYIGLQIPKLAILQWPTTTRAGYYTMAYKYSSWPFYNGPHSLILHWSTVTQAGHFVMASSHPSWLSYNGPQYSQNIYLESVLRIKRLAFCCCCCFVCYSVDCFVLNLKYMYTFHFAVIVSRFLYIYKNNNLTLSNNI